MSVTRRLSLDEAACGHCESTRIRPLWSLPRCVCHRFTKSLSVTPRAHHCVLLSVSASAVCGGPVCSCRSLSHTPLRRRAKHHCTDRIRVDARLTLSPANARGVVVSDMHPAFEWGIRPVGVVAPTAAAQRAALVDLFIATDGNAWTSGKTGWQDHAAGSDPCDNSWSGVTCSGSSGSANRGV
jgi:hypothetical protein